MRAVLFFSGALSELMYLIFEIPTNITTAQLKYGDYVTINIKPSDIKSK